MSVQSVLTSLDIKDKEQEVYLALLKLGVARARTIAASVHIPRQTVYSILDSLVHKEVVEQRDKKGIKMFSATPELLFLALDRQKEEIEKKRRQIEKELPELQQIQFREPTLPKVAYYEGVDGMRRLFNDILKQHKTGIKKFRGYGINKFKEALGDILYDFVKKRASYNVETELVIGRGDDDFGITGPGNAHGRTVKRIDMPQQKAGCYIVGNRIYLFSFINQIGLVIEDGTIATLFAGIFDDHWKKTK